MNLITYVRESVHELKKVSWPTKKQAIAYTIVVVAMSVGMAVLFAILDKVFSFGLDKLI